MSDEPKREQRRLMMAGLGAVLGLGLVADGDAVRANDGFDNPSTGSAPCVVLNSYMVEDPVRAAGGGMLYGASASIENVCGRTLEVQFCFLYAEPVDERDRNCFQGPVRPWDTARIEEPHAPVRVTGTDYRWRYLEPSW